MVSMLSSRGAMVSRSTFQSSPRLYVPDRVTDVLPPWARAYSRINTQQRRQRFSDDRAIGDDRNLNRRQTSRA